MRERIFREVVSNILIHREYLNHYPAKLIIEKNQVFTENGNGSHGYRLIIPSNFSPFPKNPGIARFFGVNPQLVEEDIFKIIIPLSKQAEGLSEGLTLLLEIIKKHPGIIPGRNRLLLVAPHD